MKQPSDLFKTVKPKLVLIDLDAILMFAVNEHGIPTPKMAQALEDIVPEFFDGVPLGLLVQDDNTIFAKMLPSQKKQNIFLKHTLRISGATIKIDLSFPELEKNFSSLLPSVKFEKVFLYHSQQKEPVKFNFEFYPFQELLSDKLPTKQISHAISPEQILVITKQKNIFEFFNTQKYKVITPAPIGVLDKKAREDFFAYMKDSKNENSAVHVRTDFDETLVFGDLAWFLEGRDNPKKLQLNSFAFTFLNNLKQKYKITTQQLLTSRVPYAQHKKELEERIEGLELKNADSTPDQETLSVLTKSDDIPEKFLPWLRDKRGLTIDIDPNYSFTAMAYTNDPLGFCKKLLLVVTEILHKNLRDCVFVILDDDLSVINAFKYYQSLRQSGTVIVKTDEHTVEVRNKQTDSVVDTIDISWCPPLIDVPDISDRNITFFAIAVHTGGEFNQYDKAMLRVLFPQNKGKKIVTEEKHDSTTDKTAAPKEKVDPANIPLSPKPHEEIQPEHQGTSMTR